MSGFRKFILRGNLVDLAVAVVIGTQFSDLVKQFVQSFVNPLLALVGGKPNFTGLVLTIGKARFTYGAFLADVVSFLISGAVVYFVIVLPVARLLRLFERDVEASERDCPECTAEIAPATGPSPTVPAPRRG
jgi:large conductance mechanosensitive channel